MKIVQFADYYNEITGNPIQVYANSIKQKNYDVFVFTSDETPNKTGFDDTKSTIKIHRFRGIRFGSKCFFPGVFPSLLFKIKKEDIVHSHVLGFFSTFIAGYLRFFKKFKFVLTPDYDVLGKKQNFILRLFNHFFFVIPARNADLLIPFTEKEKEVLKERFGFNEKKMKVLPIGVEWKKFRKEQNLGLRKKFGLEKKFVLLSVCYVARKKNLEMMINSLKGLPENIVLVHAGGHPDAKYKKELDELILKLDLQKRVLFLGNKTLNELTQIYSIGDLFVNSGFNESYCIPVIEAMASGLPVLTTKVGIAEEAVIEGTNGFYIKTEQELTEKIIFLFNNEEKRKKISKENISVSKNFDWQNIINKLEQIYLSL
ncbi:glycosyltransferase family 4 protein [Candidatus Micrarchaeota archaeon]|nr:glycosyltransferase family 4 protein [Candidatus Micrarchaeota archaeon]